MGVLHPHTALLNSGDKGVSFALWHVTRGQEVPDSKHPLVHNSWKQAKFHSTIGRQRK